MFNNIICKRSNFVLSHWSLSNVTISNVFFKYGWKRKENQNQICACFHVKWKNIKNARNLHIFLFELMGNKIVRSEQSRTAEILLFHFTILCTKRVSQLQNCNEHFQSLLNAHTTMETKCIDPTHIHTERHSSLNFSF